MTVTMLLNSSAPFCWVVPAAAAAAGVGAGVGVVTRAAPLVVLLPARLAAVVWPVMSWVMRVATSAALAWRRKTTSVFVFGSELVSSCSISLSKKSCWSADPMRITRLVRSSAVKLVPVLRRNGEAPAAAGVRRRAVSLLTRSTAIACLSE